MNHADEFLGFITDDTQTDERRVKIGLLADLMTLAHSEQGINLEKLVSQLEAHCLKLALEKHAGDLGRAALWLGFRSPAALKFLLQRHPSIKP